MDCTNIIIAIVAVYGAAVSTWNLIQNIKKRKRKLIVYIKGGVSNSGQDIIVIHVKNPPGYATVTFDSPQFLLPNDKIIILSTPLNDIRFPYELSEGKYCPIIFEMQDVITGATKAGYSGIIELRAKVVGGTSKAYISKTAFELNLS